MDSISFLDCHISSDLSMTEHTSHLVKKLLLSQEAKTVWSLYLAPHKLLWGYKKNPISQCDGEGISAELWDALSVQLGT